MKTPRYWLTVYLAATDEIVTSGPPEDVCRAMGLKRESLSSFLHYLAAGRDVSYTVIREDMKTGDFRVYGENNRGRKKDTRWDRVPELYRDGLLDCEIGRIVGLHPTVIGNWRKRNGLARNSKEGRKRNGRRIHEISAGENPPGSRERI